MVGYNESSGSSQSNSSSRVSRPEELAAYFKNMDQLSGGHDVTTQVQKTTKSGKPKLNAQGQPAMKNVTTYAPGRLGQWATQGTPQVAYTPDSTQVNYAPIQRDVNYQALSADELKSLGGAGATRELAAKRTYGQTADQIAADPRLSVFQASRGRQLAGRDLADSLDAIGQESEAAITNLAQRQHELGYQSDSANRSFTADQAAKVFDAESANRAYGASERGRAYDAAVRNADLSREDLLALAQLYFGGKGSYSKGSSSSQSSSAGGSLL